MAWTTVPWSGVAPLIGSPLVSVLVPCHNYGRYVDECVTSVLSQSIVGSERIEIIVLDDGSTDDSWDEIESIARRTGIEALRSERNVGHVATLDRLIGLAAGTYVVVLDADDRAVDRDALRSQVDALLANPDAGIACGDYLLVDESGRRIGRERVDAPRTLAARDAFAHLLLSNFIPHSGTLVRREAYQHLGAHDPAFHYSHDWELWLRLTSRYGVVRVPRPLYAYRMHAGSLRRTAALERTVPEFEAVLEHARSYSPLETSAFERLRRRGVANMFVLRSAVYLSRGMVRLGLADLRTALRIDARALASKRVPRAFASALLSRLVGSRKELLIQTLRRSIMRGRFGFRMHRD